MYIVSQIMTCNQLHVYDQLLLAACVHTASYNPVSWKIDHSFFLAQEVTEHLTEHTSLIKTENHRLRKELQDLIETTNDLQVQKKRLERQYQALLQEHQYNQSIQQLRGSVFRSNTTV